MHKLVRALAAADAAVRAQDDTDPFGVDAARIYSSNTLDPRLSDLCETSLSRRDFQHHARLPDNHHLISFINDGVSCTAIIEVMKVPEQGDALVVQAVFPVSPKGLKADIEAIKALY